MVKDDVLFHFVLFIDILLCIAIIACNLALLLSILASKAARARVRNVMLVGICLADLLLGAFTHPVYIHSYRTGTMFQSCEMHVLLQLVGDYSQVWGFVVLGFVVVYSFVLSLFVSSRLALVIKSLCSLPVMIHPSNTV
ncbi:hypothetical protein BaRGS_00023979 [Batillaria attramentaria]|uniref:G-protein coupled receptors family 1 profile domain-containing protein n=1 Tax=Batillaria attramentaria TaxID=370345 RepID=A0ABD0KCV2_9CAEN